MQKKINLVVGETPIEVHTPTTIKKLWGVCDDAMVVTDQKNHWVILSTTVVLQAPTKVLRAIYAHECGHIALGHLIGVYGVLNSQKAEIGADAWAAERGHAKGLKKYLTQLSSRVKDKELKGLVKERITNLK